ALELVRAGLGDDVDDTAGGAAVLGVVATGDDLDLFDEVVDDRRADRAVRQAGRVDAVDVVLVLERRATRERDADAVALRTGGCTECRLERTTRHRDVLDVVLVDRDALRRRRRVDRRSGVDDLDRLAADLGRVDRLIDGRRLADTDVDTRALDRLVRVIERDEVVAGGQLVDLIDTVVAGDRGLRLRQRGRRDD